MRVEGGLLLLQRVDGMDHALVAGVAGARPLCGWNFVTCSMNRTSYSRPSWKMRA